MSVGGQRSIPVIALPEWIKILVLGVVQGLTEFFPVSSSGHLVLAKEILGIATEGAALEISLHLATVVAIIVGLRRDIRRLLAAFFGGLFGKVLRGRVREAWTDAHFRMSVLILLGSVPAALVGLLLDDWIEAQFGNVLLVGIALLATGAILLSTRLARARAGAAIGPGRVLIIGVAQALAILPGISRSGSTISAALWTGIERDQAARFSFLLFLPAGLGAALLKLPGAFEAGMEVSTGALAIGFVAAGLVSYVALFTLLRIVRRGGLFWFAPYCWAVGMLAIAAA